MSPQKRLFAYIGATLWILTLVFALLPSWPHLYYRLSPRISDVLASTIASTALDVPQVTEEPDKPTQAIPSPTPTPSLPITDPSLPEENGLIIDSIGVKGEVHEGSDWENILKKGIWRVPDLGTPPENTKPIIIAAHRWGYLEWSAAFRKLNSFYNLPKVKAGDIIKIIWEQREFEYHVYATATGTEITDYEADLILYTCQLWNSPTRFFVFANRI